MGGVVVLLPVFNAAKFLEGALKSLTEQVSCGFSVAAVDDASNDGSFEILREFADSSSLRVSVAQNERNLGMASNWNACIDLAYREFNKPDYFLKLDADDILSAGSIKCLENLLCAESHAVLAFCRTEIASHIGAAGNTVSLFSRLTGDGIIDEERRFFPSREMLFLMLRYDNLLPSSGTMWRADLKGGSRFDPRFRWAADYEFWTRALRRGGAVYCPDCTVDYFVHDGGVTGQIEVSQRAWEVARVGVLRVIDSVRLLGPRRAAGVIGTLIRRSAAVRLFQPRWLREHRSK